MQVRSNELHKKQKRDQKSSPVVGAMAEAEFEAEGQQDVLQTVLLRGGKSKKEGRGRNRQKQMQITLY